MDDVLKPLRFDNTPRFVEFSVPCDLSESVLYDALVQLRPMVQARGYNNRQIEFSDCVLVCSERWTKKADELQKQYPGLRIQTVTPAILKTEAAWALVFGIDSFISLPAW